MGTGRTVRRVATGLTVAAGVAALGVAYFLRRPLPGTRGRLTLKGLRDNVEILRDRWGVPHIYASTQHDMFFAVGFAQAQDRLWQMEFNRRVAAGRLSEVLGEPALEIDRMVRRVGFRRAAEADWKECEEGEREVVEAYCAGVNAYMQRGKLPIEFTILRTRPEPWTPLDTFAFGRWFGWALAGNWDSEIMRSWTIEKFGAAMMAELEPAYPQGGPVIVPPGTSAKGLRLDLIEELGTSEELTGVATGAMSNNWAVDGSKSVTGRPLLASDPHLPLSMPSLWWEVHVDSPHVKAAGVGIPGMPGVLMGHNDRIAWGMTSAQADGDDLFVEEVNPDQPSQFRYKGKWVSAEMVREEIKVRGRAKPLVEAVMITRNGPVISPAVKGETRTLSLRTVTLERSQQIRAQVGLLRARDWEGFQEALATWPYPSLNFAYADVDGNIGYHLAGLIPVRGKGHGIVPSPGWTEEYQWKGFVPFGELPHAYNPPTHWVASANNQIAEDDYPHFLGANFADSARQQRIIDMLEEKDKHSTEDFKRMQVDQFSIPARDFVPVILQLQPKDEWGQRAMTFLRSWDYRVSADSVGACVYEVFFAHLVRRTLEEKLGSWSDFFLGRGVHALRRSSFFNVAYSWLMEKMRERPAWFEGKTWHEVMEECLASATTELRGLLGDEVSRWQWGQLHKQSFRHPLGQVRGLDRIFNRGPVPVGGDSNTVWQAAYAPYHGYDVNSFTASWRQVIDLGDFNRSEAVLPNGESGHPGSRHYQDMIPLWRRGKYHPMAWDRDEVERVASRRLELGPG